METVNTHVLKLLKNLYGQKEAGRVWKGSFNERFNYRAIIGRLNFLEKSTRPDIAYVVHQHTRFAANPKA